MGGVVGFFDLVDDDGGFVFGYEGVLFDCFEMLFEFVEVWMYVGW